MYTDEFAERLKYRAGQKYQPSNGTEGVLFMENFCHRCTQDSDANPCPIIAYSMIYNVDDPEYPHEWQYGEDGQPICTAFKPVG